MAIVQQFDLDVIPQTKKKIINVNQYDTGTGRIVIKLKNGLNDYSPSNATVKIQGTKPDKSTFEVNASISGNTVTSNLTSDMTSVFGDVVAQVVITEGNNKTGTSIFILRVQKASYDE